MVKYSAVRWRSALVGSVLPLLAVSSTHGQCMYEVTLTVGPWCGKIFGYPPTRGTGVSAQGDVVGWYTSCLIGPDRAFLWTAQAGLTTLAIPTGFSEALATDISGPRIVGQIELVSTDRYLAALWQDGQVVNLGTLPGGNFSQAFAGQRVGVRATDEDGKWAVYYRTFRVGTLDQRQGRPRRKRPRGSSASARYARESQRTTPD